MRIRNIFVALAAIAALTGARADAQEEARRQELEREMRELSQRLEVIRRELGSSTRFAMPFTVFTTNRARLGVVVRTEVNEQTDSVGAYLTDVTWGGPADKAGLEAGDIILKMNGAALSGEYDEAGLFESPAGRRLVDIARELEVGDEIEIEYLRDGRRQTATVIAEEVDGPSGFGYRFSPDDRFQLREFAPQIEVQIPRITGWLAQSFGGWLDIELVELDSELGEYFGTSEGLLVVRAPDDDEIDLRSGDVILRIGDRSPQSPSHAMRILRSYDVGETVSLHIMRKQRQMSIEVEVPEDEHNGFFYQPRRRQPQ